MHFFWKTREQQRKENGQKVGLLFLFVFEKNSLGSDSKLMKSTLMKKDYCKTSEEM